MEQKCAPGSSSLSANKSNKKSPSRCRLSKDVKTKLKLVALLRVQCGEGLEDSKKETDFAEEVAALGGRV